MASLTPEMKKLFSEQVGIIGTASKDGKPNLAPKGTLTILDDSTLVFAELAGQVTYQNLLENPVAIVAVVDRANRAMVRCFGKAEVLTSGELFDNMVAKVEQMGRPRPKAAVKITIESVREMRV